MIKQALLNSRLVISLSILIFLLSISILNAQSTEADFLLYSPSPVITGMGGAGTAIPTEDPYNFFYNPAQLGLIDSNTNISLGIYPSSVNLSPFTEVLFDNYAIQGGYDFSKLLGGFPLKIGAGILYQGIDFGEFFRAHESGQILSKLHLYEKAGTFSIGFGFNYFIKIAGGISYKLIRSYNDLFSYSDSTFNSTQGNADAFDLGILVDVPIITKMPLGKNLNFNLSASSGYTFANWGSAMIYTGSYSASSGPIARTVRLGYGLSAGIDYKYKETVYKLLQIDWSSEANDLLVEMVEKIYPPDTVYTYGYKSPLGDINIWDNVIMMKNNSSSVVNRHGVKFSILETADISFGRYGLPGTYGKLLGSTFGFSASTKGLMKFLSQEIKNDIIEFIAKHISLQYSNSTIKYDDRKDEDGNTYKYPGQNYNALYLAISGLW